MVDDEPAVRESLERALVARATACCSRRTARRRSQRSTTDRPDLVLLDVLMPALDGLEACRRLRAAANRAPVLMLTARDGVGDRVAGLDAGADDYLVKPFALDELFARIRALLRRAAPARRAPSVSPTSSSSRARTRRGGRP